MAPRGIRNNNPGNIEHGIDWNGMAEEQPDERFIKFKDPEHGIRAMARILMTYTNKYGISSVYDAVCRWAPPHENDSDAYAAFVADCMDVDPHECIDLTNRSILAKMIPAMIKMENGEQPYPLEQIKEGISLV
jgi:hypothetical protein